MKIRVMLLTLLALPVFAFASGEEPAIYVIKQGDTLWGLSERFIKDPKYWPNMWSNNSQVTNPHFIYPGQQLRVFPDRLEFIPKDQAVNNVATTAPAQKSAPAAQVAEAIKDVAAEKTYTLYGTEGFIAEPSFKPYGVIVGTQHDRIVTGIDDIVYTDIGLSHNAKSGDKFSIFRKDILINHPANSEKMGSRVLPLGVLQLTDVENNSSRAIITKSIREVGPGAYLMPFKEKRQREISLKNNSRDFKGYIVESSNGSNIIASGDVVYIDLGTAHGLEAGNMLYIVRDVKIDQKLVEGRFDKLPQEILGAIVVLETSRLTSSALVVKSIETIYKGERIVSQTK